jgi:hypothetical protein
MAVLHSNAKFLGTLVALLFCASFSLTLLGCTSLDPTYNNTKNPKAFVEKCYQIPAGLPVTGYADTHSYAFLVQKRDTGQGVAALMDSNTQHELAYHAVELNVGTNSIEETVPLLVQITGYKEITEKDLLWKVTVLNKKFATSSWWVPSHVVLKDGKETAYPFYKATKAPKAPKATVQTGKPAIHHR